MGYLNNSVISPGVSTLIRRNTSPPRFNREVGNKYVASLKKINQTEVLFSPQLGQSTTESDSSSPSGRTQQDALGTKVTNVRGDSNSDAIKNENNSISSFSAHDVMIVNDIFHSLDTKSTFVNKSEREAMDFLRKEIGNDDFKKLESVFSVEDSESLTVKKAKQIFCMLKMLSDYSTKSDEKNSSEIKSDIKFYVDNIIKYKLGEASPFAGSLKKGAAVLEAIDARFNKNAAQFAARKLNHNANIERLVESKINTIQDKKLKETLLSNWKETAFRSSKLDSDKMENILNESNLFYSVDALLNHQPIKLELFKDFLQRNAADQGNDAKNTGTEKPNNGVNKDTSGPTYVYNDYSRTTNDNSIHFTDNSRSSMKETVNPPNGQEEQSPAFAKASATQHQNVSTVPETQSDRNTDGRGQTRRQMRPEATVGTSDATVNSHKPSNEAQTPPVTAGEHAGVDDIKEPAIPREASSTPDINEELNVRTSVQQAQAERVGYPGSSVAAHQTSYIGPFTTGGRGAAEFQKYKQSSDNRLFGKKNESPITPSNNAGSGIKNDVARSLDENVSRPNPHIKAGENPVSDRGENQALHAAPFTRQRAQFAATLTKAKSNAAIVPSSDPLSQEGGSPSVDFYIGPNRTGSTGAAELKRYWQSAQKTVAETDTQAGRRELLPGRDDSELLTRSNTAGGENVGERDGSKVNLKANNVFETQPQKATASPTQAMRQQPLLMDVAGINKQKSNTYMGPHRTGGTGAAGFKKYESGSNTLAVSHGLNRSSGAERNAEPLVNVIPTNASDRRAVNQRDTAVPANRGGEHTASVAQHNIRVEPEITKVEIVNEVLPADTAPDANSSREPSLANRHDVASSGENNTVTAAGNAAYKGPFWTGRQGATAKQSYINTDRFAKK